MVERYRLTKPTLGIVAETHLAVTVPEGAILEIATAPQVVDRTVEVRWKGKTMIMFIRDLTERTAKVNESTTF